MDCRRGLSDNGMNLTAATRPQCAEPYASLAMANNVVNEECVDGAIEGSPCQVPRGQCCMTTRWS